MDELISMRFDDGRAGGAEPPPIWVRKRDGRMEELNDGKLRLSIHRALVSARMSELWRVEVVASVVLRGLRTRHGPSAVLTTAAIAAATGLVMDIAGCRQAASAYRVIGQDRHSWPATSTGASAQSVSRM